MLELRKMTEEEYSKYLEAGLIEYAEEKMKAEGHSREQAMKIAQDSFNHLVPQGINTENQFLFTVVESATLKAVGILWFARKTTGMKVTAFIYDIKLVPEVRGRGFGTQLMSLTESEVKKLGVSSIGLHVFGHNEIAIKLYEKMGFRTTNRMMAKDLV